MEIKSWSIPGNLSGFWQSSRSVRDFGRSSARHLPLTKKEWSPLGGLFFYSNIPVHYVVIFKIVRVLTEARWIAASSILSSSQWQKSNSNLFTPLMVKKHSCHRAPLAGMAIRRVQVFNWSFCRIWLNQGGSREFCSPGKSKDEKTNPKSKD